MENVSFLSTYSSKVMIRVVKESNLVNLVEKFFISSTTSACFHLCVLSEKNSKWSTKSQRECEESIDLSLWFPNNIIIKCTRFISELFPTSLVSIKITLSRLRRLFFFLFYRRYCKATGRHSCI